MSCRTSATESFKQWVLSQDQYDLSRFKFLGLPSPEILMAVYNRSDLHIHLTVPHVPSVSLLQAMASGCPILGSATLPVQEFIDNGVQGQLVGFDNVDAITETALDLLKQPDKAKALGQAARLRVMERYEMTQCLHRLCEFFKEFDTIYQCPRSSACFDVRLFEPEAFATASGSNCVRRPMFSLSPLRNAQQCLSPTRSVVHSPDSNNHNRPRVSSVARLTNTTRRG
jgi:hypothetical protein